jgi:DNA-binding beta-propeller fold protein YncE
VSRTLGCGFLLAMLVAGRPADVLAGSVYWTNQTDKKIQRTDLAGGPVEDLLTSTDGLVSPRGIALDPDRGRIYWTDDATNKIRCADLDGKNPQDLIAVSGTAFLADIALDQRDGKVYWADRDGNAIRRADLNGSNIETVLSVSQPYFLTLDVPANKLYWSDFNSSIIHRADLNGSGSADFITGLGRARDIALDTVAGEIYWADRGTSPKIQRKNLDGTGTTQDLFDSSDGLIRPHGIAIDPPAGKIYWADTDKHCLLRGNMDGTGSPEIFYNGGTSASPWGVALDTRPAPEPSVLSLGLAALVGILLLHRLRGRE